MTPQPKPTPRNPSKPAQQMRADADGQARDALVAKISTEWRAYREATPIAAETFVPPVLCAALDELAEEVL